MTDLMDSRLFRAATIGDIHFLDESIEVAKQKGQKLSEYWLRTTSQNNNIIHISAKHNNSAEFTKEVLKKFPVSSLITQQNVDGNTSLHIAMLKGNMHVAESILAGAVSTNTPQQHIWNIQNLHGDTAFHLALSKPRDDDWVKFVLAKLNIPITVSLLNKSNHSPLHLYVRHFCHDIPQQEMKQQTIKEHIRALIQANKTSACIKDIEGVTPLIQAAKIGCLSAVQIIVEECPESVEMCDPTGRTFLHLIQKVGYQQYKDLLDVDMIRALINIEDDQGNTSLHLAVQRHDLAAVRALLECGADINIKNKEGVSVSDISESDTAFFGKVMDTIYSTVETGIMNNELVSAIEKGDLTLLNEREVRYDDSYFLSRTLDGSNIIHLAIQNDQLEWAKSALELYPQLIYQVDIQGENPLHIAAKFGNPTARIVVGSTLDCLQKAREGGHKVQFGINPFMAKNSRGNIPLHEVFCANNYEFALDLINSTPQASSIMNHNGETPLHLFAKFGAFIQNYTDQHKVVDAIVTANKSVASMRDNEGFTPPLRAAQSSRLSACMLIISVSPESIKLRDLKGRTVLHHFVNYDTSTEFVGNGPLDLLDDIWGLVPGVDALRAAQDVDGNTPLHYALKEGDVTMAKFFVDRCVKAQVRLELSLLDNQGLSVLKLLALHPNSSAHVTMKERIENCMGKRVVMKDELYAAVVKGKLASFLSQTGDESDFTESDFLSQTTNGSNIVHLAIKHGHSECVKKALERFPHLILQVDSNGDCPLHTAAKFNNPASEIVVDYSVECYNNIPKTAFITSIPFQMRNSWGNTPLHEALRASNYNIAMEMIKKYPSVAIMTNHVGETPLHMIARYGSRYTSTMKLTEIVDGLVNVNDSIAYARDVDGFTPLLRAVQNGQFLMCGNIIERRPQSVELCDLEDRSILHHFVHFTTSIDNNRSDAMDFLVYILHVFRQLRTLRAKQDKNGETPLHYAIKKGDLTLAKILFEMCFETQNTEELYMVDNQGNSILSLLASHPDSFLQMSMKAKKRNWMGKELRLMTDKIYDAVVQGDMSTLVNESDNMDLLSQTYEGSNIVHLAIKANDAKGFEVLQIELLFQLALEKDCHGETPVHIAAKFDNSASEKLLKVCLREYEGVSERTFGTSTLFLAQNSAGNSPLHEALAASNYKFAIELIRNFGPATLVTNHIGETPLHIFARCGTNTGHIQKEIVHELIKADSYMAYKRDADGLTPLLRAAKSGRLWLCRTIILLCPQALEIRDLNGRSILHHCVHYKSIVDDEVDNGLEAIESLWDEAPGLDSLRVAQDMYGNTPLHYAIKEDDISLAYILVERCVKAPAKQELFNADIQGNSVLHLLASHPKSSAHIAMKEKIENCIGQKVLMKNELYEKVVNRKLLEHLVDMDEKVDWSRELLYMFREEEDVKDKNDSGTNSIPTTINTDNELISRAADGSNILHLAIKHRSPPPAAMKVFKKWPHLVLEADANGDNPLHIAARFRHNSGLKVLHSLHRYYKTGKGKFRIHPYQMKNATGDTPLHEALRASNAKAALVLIQLDPYTALTKNNVGETPLHLFATYGTYTHKETLDAFEKVLDVGLMAASTRDIEGFSPLLRAVQSGRIQVAWLIAQKVPGAIEVCDFKGRTMLHHLRIHANEMVETSMRGGEISFSDFMDGVDSLRTVRDLDGNTPLHYNLKFGNFATARLLMERCASSDQRAELTMLNNDGESILDLLRMQIAQLKKDEDGNATLQLAISQADVLNMNELIVKDLDSEKMTKELYDAAVTGSTTIFEDIVEGSTAKKIIREHHLARTSDGSNIVHLALRHGKKDFIEKALHHFPELIFQRDYNSDTPTHVAARNYKAKSSSKGILEAAKSVIDKAEECRSELFNRNTRSWIPYVWDLRNSQGNTPLHEAVRGGSLRSVHELVDIIDKSECETYDVISMANNEGETPLHMYARYATPINSRNNQSNKSPVEKLDVDTLELLIGKSPSIMYMRDRDGLTPLLRAAETGNIDLARAIWKIYPQAMQLRDTNGRTFLHLMDLSKIISKPSNIFDEKEIDALRAVQDDDGNTPLHFAIKSGKYKKAKILMQRSVEAKDSRELYLANQQGEHVQTLLAQDDVPNEVINVYKKFDPTYISNYELRSSYGITRKQIKERADSLSVIAALLATITFAAAFTVPGGLNQDIGIPIFVRKILFKAFMFLDTLAMCGSMLVLYFLVWVMIGSKSESFLLIDMSIVLLQGSFMATILAFAAGVFVTTHNEIQWLAILVWILCGALTLVLNRTGLSLLTQFLMDYCMPSLNWILVRLYYIPLSKMTDWFKSFCRCLKRGVVQDHQIA